MKCRSTISGGRGIAARGPSEGKPSLSMQGGPRSSPLPLHVPNQSSLRAGGAVDVAFGRLDGAMAGEELDVAQAASNVARGDGATWTRQAEGRECWQFRYADEVWGLSQLVAH